MNNHPLVIFYYPAAEPKLKMRLKFLTSPYILVPYVLVPYILVSYILVP